MSSCLRTCRGVVVQILSADEDNFSVDCAELARFCEPLYNNLVTYPREVIPILDDVVNTIARELRAQATADAVGADGSQVGLGDDTSAPINVRPYNLTEQRAIRDLDPNDIEALVQVDGMVTRVSNVTPDMRCAALFHVLLCRLQVRGAALSASPLQRTAIVLLPALVGTRAWLSDLILRCGACACHNEKRRWTCVHAESPNSRARSVIQRCGWPTKRARSRSRTDA